MYDHRKNVKNEWQDFKFSAEEVQKCKKLTVLECLKDFNLIDEIAKAKGVALTPADRQEIFRKLAPDYKELANDLISDQLVKLEQQKQKTTG